MQPKEIEAILSAQQDYFASGVTLPVESGIEALR